MTTAMTPATRERNYEIDLLRGMACAMVVGFHFLYRGQYDGWIEDAVPAWVSHLAVYGYLGVHLFFIISGYVIFMSARHVSAQSFLASRVSRLFPAYWVAVCLTSSLAWWTASQFAVSGRDVLINLTMLTHWVPLRYDVQWVDGAYWSLAIEFQFYVLMWCVSRWNAWSSLNRLLAVWLLLSALNFMRPMYTLQLWLVVQWAPLFTAGMVFYQVRQEGWSRGRVGLLVAAGVLALMQSTRPFILNAWNAAAYPLEASDADLNPWVITSVISVFFGIFGLIAARRWAITRPYPVVVWAGILTYPVYLIHQNLGYIVLKSLRPGWASWPGRLLLVLGLIWALAVLVHLLVEKPLAPRLRRLIDPRPARAATPRGVSLA